MAVSASASASASVPDPPLNSFFSLPPELLAALVESFPCRGPQIRTLAALVHPDAAPARNLVVHGVEATGKSAVTAQLLAALHGHHHHHRHRHADPTSTAATTTTTAALLDYAVIRSAECVTARHLFERTVTAVADAVVGDGGGGDVGVPAPGRCETLAALTVELRRVLEGYGGRRRDQDRAREGVETKRRRRFVLVFDGIDRQREAPPTLFPALARLSEIVSFILRESYAHAW